MKWHPDRNPGREAEVNAKFQTIQSAHEVLTDEVERRRYDAGRIRTTRFSSSTAGTRGNPYSNAGAQWAPPPKPFGTPRANAAGQGTSNGASTGGASRYSKFNPEGSFRNTPNRPPDQETKNNHYQAWEKMRKPHAPEKNPATGTFARPGRWQPSGSPKAPDPRYTPQSGREESNNQKHAPPPKPSRPGYDEWNAGEMHGRYSPRKSGFMPTNPNGDEPPAPAASSAYFNARSSRAPTAKTSTGPEPPPRPKGFERFRDPDEPVDGVGRQSTPYATHGGEKTNPFDSSNMHRAKTTRERPSANGYSTTWETRSAEPPPSSNSREKPRSASPPRSRGFQTQPPDSGRAESPPKRTHSHINISPLASETVGNKKGGSSKLNARFKKASAMSDTSSDDEDSDVQAPPTNRIPRKNLPRRKQSVQKEADNVSKPSNEQQRKPNLADFRKMFHSGDPLLNQLCSEQSGTPKGPDTTPQQPMYGQDSHRHSSFSNISRLPFTSSYLRFQPSSYQPASKDQPSQDELKFQTLKDRLNERKPPSQLNGSFMAENEDAFSNLRDSWRTSESSPSITSPANNLSSFEQSMMGGLRRRIVTSDSPSSNTTTRDTSRGGRVNIVFGRSTPLSSSNDGSPLQTDTTNLENQESCNICKNPKRKVGDYDNNVNNPNEAPRKFPGYLYGGLNDLLSNNTDQINNRFPPYRTQPTAVPPLFTAPNAESINTVFETKNWDGQFRATSFVNPTEFGNGPTRAGSRNGRRSPVKAKSAGRTRSASASIHSEGSAAFERQTTNQPVESPSKTFTPEEWAVPEMFQASTFAPPMPQGPAKTQFNQRTPSRKGSRTKGSQVNKTAGGKAAVVNEDVSDSDKDLFEEPSSGINGGSSSASAPQTGTSSPNAMDIDSPYENNGHTGADSRNVPVEPLRPEWRAGAVNGDVQPQNLASRAPMQSATKDDDSKLNFGDLKNVEPLFQRAEGLDSVNDLKSSLPFTSAAASTVPTKLPDPLQSSIQVPTPPYPPKIPSRPTDGVQRMSPSSWHSYLISFQAYITDYQLYNQKIESYFQARRTQYESLLEHSGWSWLVSKSDEIFEKEWLGAKEDRIVKEKWVEAAAGYHNALEEFRNVRAAMMGRMQ